jgi:hypothetical protein
MAYCGCSGVHQAGAYISYRIGPLCNAIVSLIGKNQLKLAAEPMMGTEQLARTA